MSKEDKATDKEPAKKAAESKSAEKQAIQNNERMVHVEIGNEPITYRVGTWAAKSRQVWPEKDAEFYEKKGQLKILGLA